jgi:hypothetical protein
MPASDRNNKLAQAFKFSESDLLLNREGKTADTQKQIIASARKTRMVSIVVYIVMIVLFLLVCIGVGLSLLLNRDGSTTRLAIMFAMAVATLLFAGAAANYYLRSRDLWASTVSHLDGTAKPHTRQYRASYDDLGGAGLGMGWFVKVGSKEFRLPTSEQYAAFEEGMNYRIHYVKNTPFDLILSAEAL